MDAIGPGDLVEYVNPDGESARLGILRVGGRYFIDRLESWDGCRCRHPNHPPALFLSGIDHQKVARFGFCVFSFRPLKSDISSLEKLLTSPVFVDEGV